MVDGGSRGDQEKPARSENLMHGPKIVLPQRERNVVIRRGRLPILIRDGILFGELSILRRQHGATEEHQKAVAHSDCNKPYSHSTTNVSFCKFYYDKDVYGHLRPVADWH